MKGEPLVLEGLVKKYGNVTAVSDVSFDIHAGEFVSILGPSGSGKTTLLMMIAGFEMPNTGRVLLGGEDITYTAPNRRNVGMVFQKYALFPHMTVAQNIAFPLKMRSFEKTEIADKVNGALSLVRMSGFEDRYPNQLSGGQQQRIAVARALVFEPPVLLMDEPLGALDKKLREEMQLEIKSLQQRLGVTVVYVTHDQEEALTMSDRVAVMDSASLVQIGTPKELYQAPNSSLVAGFIGKMNFLEGVLHLAPSTQPHIQISEDVALPLSGVKSLQLGELTDGQVVKMAMRPERVAISVAGKGGAKGLRCTVQSVIFAGSFYIVLAQPEGIDVAPMQLHIATGAALKGVSARTLIDVVPDGASLRFFAADEG